MGLVQKSFSDIITFDRTSNATRVGPTGVLEYAPHNLIQRSQEFDNAYWSKTASSVTANTTSAPDGTVTADSLIENSADTQHYLSRNLGTLVGTHTISFYAKANGRNWIAINLVTAADNRTFFNLSTGVVGTNASGNAATITNVGNGWYRCSVSRTLDSATWFVELYLASSDGTLSYPGDGTSGIFLWGAQLAVGPYALDYVPTTNAAVYGPRFDYDGSGVTIVEPVSTNLLLYSQEFNNAAWSTSVTAVTANNAIAPDGTLTADTATIQNTGYLVQTYTAPSSLPYVLSVWMRAASSTTVKLGFQSPSDVTSCNVTTTWQRFTHTNVRNGLFYPQIYNDSGSAVTVELWGAQLEVGSTATAYMVSGATNGFRAVPVVSGSATPKGLLVEEQRTNLLLYSEQFDNAYWTKSSSGGGSAPVVTANAASAPDGTVTADQIVFVAPVSGDLSAIYAAPSTAAGSYTGSFYVKAQSAADVGKIIGFRHVAAGGLLLITLTDSWTRVSVTESRATDNFEIVLRPALGTSSGTVSIYIWGAQLEAGSFATSLIPTLASTVTRSADVASVNTLSPWYSATEGTLFAECVISANVASSRVIASLSDGGTNNENLLYSYETTIQSLIQVSGVTQASLLTANSFTVGNVLKSASGYKANDFGLVLNAGAVVTDTSGTIPSVNVLKIGVRGDGTLQQTFHLRRLAYYPRKLSSAEIQALTS